MRSVFLARAFFPSRHHVLRASSRVRAGVFAMAALLLLCAVRPAHAGRNDLRLSNLCPRTTGGECAWINRDAAGLISGVNNPLAGGVNANESFRSLMSELGTVLAPHIVVPASTLGFSGFQISADVAMTSISNKAQHWDGIEWVEPQNRTGRRPDGHLTTVGVSIRKGIWLPVPSMEVGAGFIHLLESQMIAYQAYAKLAIHEGFRKIPLPNIAGRVGLSHVTGANDARIDILGLDLIISKAFGVFGTWRFEPFAGLSQFIIRARSDIFDLTPGCDGYAALDAMSTNKTAGPDCKAAQLGSNNDLGDPKSGALGGNFAFANQDNITRNQLFAGFKMHFSAVHLTAQYGRILELNSRDSQPNGQGARDNAEAQQRFSLSAGLDF
jgi:hypothetical protein